MAVRTRGRRQTSVVLLVVGVTGIAILAASTEFSSQTRAVDVAFIGAFLVMVTGLALFPTATDQSPSHQQHSRRAAGLVNRLAVAVALNLLYWITVIEPLVYTGETLRPSFVRVVSLIDLPVAIAGLVAPYFFLYDAVDVYMQSFSYGTTRFCFGIPPGRVWPHLGVSVPTWLILLYVPELSILVRRRLNRRSDRIAT